jgi:predicted RNA-binding Zn ribbon-like protein
MATVKTISEMKLDGGMACLDFINSGYDTEREVIVERLQTYSDLLILAERLTLFKKAGISALRKLAASEKVKAQQALETARKARKVMFEVFRAIAHENLEKLDKNILDAFNTYISSALASQAFTSSGGTLQITWAEPRVNLAQPLWAFLISAYELLREKDQRYIRQCQGCEWLFIDETKNHRRKWCDMQTCGSIEKSRRYYQRKKAAKKTGD